MCAKGKNPKRFTDILHGWYPDCSPLSPSLSPFAAEPNFFCHRNFAPLCMPPSPAPLARPSCFIRGNDGGAVNWQKPVILMTINNSGGGEGRRPTYSRRYIFILCFARDTERAGKGRIGNEMQGITNYITFPPIP